MTHADPVDLVSGSGKLRLRAKCIVDSARSGHVALH
jgi:hypothetical protein